MLIDSCAVAAGATTWRPFAVPCLLLRSDYIMEPVGNQCHTYGIASWIPYYGTGSGSGAISPYLLRSVMCPHFTACFDMRRDDLDYEMIRRVLGQWREFAKYYLGDYYPLTPYSLDSHVWIAWQFDCPESGEGVVQAFRRSESAYEAARFRLLAAWNPTARYLVENLDLPETVEATGRTLTEEGLFVPIHEQPGSAVLVYRKANPGHTR